MYCTVSNSTSYLHFGQGSTTPSKTANAYFRKGTHNVFVVIHSILAILVNTLSG